MDFGNEAGLSANSRRRTELQHNVRAHDPADQRDQRLFREQQADAAVRFYAQRDRVHLAEDPRQVEDWALDQAHADRQAGKRTLVLVKTTNEHLDELNTRAQAIRYQAAELGRHGADLPGRPYQLHRGADAENGQLPPAVGEWTAEGDRFSYWLNAVRNDPAGRPTTVVHGHGQGTLAADGQTLTVSGGSEVYGGSGELLATNRADAHATRIEAA